MGVVNWGVHLCISTSQHDLVTCKQKENLPTSLIIHRPVTTIDGGAAAGQPQ